MHDVIHVEMTRWRGDDGGMKMKYHLIVNFDCFSDKIL